MTFGLEQHIIDKIISVFETNAKVEKAYVFGSRAKGNYRPDSDIDIAVKGIDITLDDILNMSVAFEDKGIKNKIDLIDYTSIKEPALQEHIDRVGIEFYSSWKERILTEMGTLQRGKSKHRPRYAFHLYGGPYPFIQTGQIREASKYITKYEQTYSEDGLAQSKLWKKGTLCITIAANIAEIAILGMDACFPDSVLGFIPNKKKCDLDFAFYTLKYFQRELQQMGDGSVQDNINLGTFTQIKFPFPPLPEQIAISSILSSLDDKIDLLQRQNTTIEQLTETLFRQWFVEEAEESWEVKSLVEIAEYLNGLALQKFPAKGNDFLPVIKIREMKQGISENTEICSSNIPIKYVIQDGDVLFSWSGSLEVVLWTGGQGALNQHLFKVTSNEYPKWFYYLATKHHLADFKTIAESKSTTMGHIQREHLEQAMISIPSKQMFEDYDLRISHLVDKLIDNNKQIRTLTQTRNTLLPKLMSGEVRVEMNK